MQTAARGKRRELVGTVVSNKMQKTIVVKMSTKIRHPMYGKVMRHENKLKVHDEKNEARPGDRVLIVESRPISKGKKWRLVKILEKSDLQTVEA